MPAHPTPSPLAGALVVLVVLGAVVAGLHGSASAAPTTRPGPEQQADELRDLLAAERRVRGLPALGWSDELAADARSWSRVMSDRDRLGHSPHLFADTARSVPGFEAAAETVGVGWSSRGLHDAMVRSPGHLDALTGDHDVVGIGVVQRATTTWVTYRFARRGGAPSGAFPDVDPTSWYGPAVTWAHTNRITDGHGDTGDFRPHHPVTRAQAVTLLWRAAGRPTTTPTTHFPDVDPTSWYGPAVTWAHTNRITDGHGDTGDFRPHHAVTRAQAVTLLWRHHG